MMRRGCLMGVSSDFFCFYPGCLMSGEGLDARRRAGLGTRANVVIGMKASGYGRFGASGLEEWVRTKTVTFRD